MSDTFAKQRSRGPVLSASQLSLYHDQCKRKWALQYLARLKSPETKGKATGTVAHWYLEQHLAAGERPVKQPSPETWQMAGVTPDRVAEMMSKALPLFAGCTPEYPFSVPLPKTNIPLVGKIDGMRARTTGPDGKPLVTDTMIDVMDLKTCKSFSYTKDVLELMDDWQGHIYVLAATTLPGYEQWTWAHCSWVYVKTSKDRATGEFPPPKPVEWWVPRKFVDKSWKKILDGTKPLLQLYSERPDPMKVEGNVDACGMYGGCPFSDRCNACFVAPSVGSSNGKVGAMSNEQAPQSTQELLAFLQKQSQGVQAAAGAPVAGTTIDQIEQAPPMYPPAPSPLPQGNVVIKATNPQPVLPDALPTAEARASVPRSDSPSAVVDAQADLRAQIEQMAQSAAEQDTQPSPTNQAPSSALTTSPPLVAQALPDEGAPKKRGRGRPKGSKSKKVSKDQGASEAATVVAAPSAAVAAPEPPLVPMEVEDTNVDAPAPAAPAVQGPLFPPPGETGSFFGVARSPVAAPAPTTKKILYVNCAPARRAVPWAIEIPQFKYAELMVEKATGVHWSLVKYNQGAALLSAEFAKVLPTIDVPEIRISTSVKGCQAVVDLLIANWADDVVTSAT